MTSVLLVKEHAQIESSVSNESVEEFELAHENFDNEVSGYVALTQLGKDEVLFVDKNRAPVGSPQKFIDYIDSKVGFTGDYLYTPGAVDDTGILSDVPAKEWRDYVKSKVQADFPTVEIVGDMNSVRIFQAAYESGDAALQTMITSGEIVTRDELLDYFIQADIPGIRDYNRVEYLQAHVQFRGQLKEAAGNHGAEKVAVPLIVQAEFRRLLPGLIAQESGFREDIENPRTGAKGSGQFMPATWQRYTGELEVSTEFVDQIAVLGPAISDMYDRVLDKIGDEALEKLRSLFPKEEDFLVDIITPLTISGYNTGPDRAAEAARLYVTSVQLNDMPVGKDLFMAIANFAEASDEGLLSSYKKESREYVTRVYAAAQVLEEKYPQKDNQDILLAQN